MSEHNHTSPSIFGGSLRTWICGGVAAIGVLAALRLAWQPTGAISPMLGMLPAVGRWIDFHGVLRNVPAFFLFSLPVLLAVRRAPARRFAVVLLALFAEIIEYPQLFMAERQFDWRDLVCSHAGILLAWMLIEARFLAGATFQLVRHFFIILRRPKDRIPVLPNVESNRA